MTLFIYREGIVTTRFTAPSSATRIGLIEPDLSIKGNLMYHVYSGLGYEQLWSTGGGNITSPVLTKHREGLSVNTSNGYYTNQISFNMRDFRHVSAHSLRLDIESYHTLSKKEKHLIFPKRQGQG